MIEKTVEISEILILKVVLHLTSVIFPWIDLKGTYFVNLRLQKMSPFLVSFKIDQSVFPYF